MEPQRSAWRATAAIAAALLLVGCREEGGPTAARPPRPVSAVRLARLDPAEKVRLTGAVTSWKQQDVGFEVSGRVEWAIEEGADVRGRTFDENGNQVTEGVVLARLDRTRYELQVSAAEAELASAQAEVAAARIEIEQVLPEQRKGAEAELARARKEFQRLKSLAAQNVGTPAELETAEATLKTAQAQVAQLGAGAKAKQAQLRALEANVLQARETVKHAERDLQDCELVAPFSARVARVHVIPGAYAAPGRAVVTLVVMDPIAIELPVSAATDRAVSYGDLVTVHPPGAETPVPGWVNVKDTIADPATRTFNLSILVRNRKVLTDPPGDPAALDLPRVKDMTAPEPLTPDAPGPLFVDVRAVCEDDRGRHVWKADNFRFAQAGRPFDPVLVVRRVPVALGERRVCVLDHVYRELRDTEGLTVRDALLWQPPEGLRDGDRVLLVRERWLLRPGSLVPVVLQLPPSGPGLYVPMEAILPEGGKHFVFTADGQALGKSRARKVEVRVTGTFGELRRIEGEGIGEGALVILSGAHYLIPEEAVSVTDVLEAAELEVGAAAGETRE